MHQNEPPRIQQEGRAGTIRKEEISQQRKLRKSQISKIGKIRNFKINCEECGNSFEAISPRKHCTKLCKDEWRLKNSKGIIKITKHKITYSTGYEVSTDKWWMNKWIMDEYKQESKAFPDWSPISKVEMYNKQLNEKLNSIPKEERQRRDKIKHAAKNKEKQRIWERAYIAKRKKEDPDFRLKVTMRSRFAKFKRGYNLKSIMSLIGCTPQELRNHMESKFERGMTWDNYGSHWHIDHIIPCKAFDHHDPKQVEQCWHWTNLQPMKARENIQKGASIKNPQMSLLIGVS